MVVALIYLLQCSLTNGVCKLTTLLLIPQLGGVVFLYHPCVAEEDKEELKMFAKSCLFQHIVTPYLLPSPEVQLTSPIHLPYYVLVVYGSCIP